VLTDKPLPDAAAVREQDAVVQSGSNTTRWAQRIPGSPSLPSPIAAHDTDTSSRRRSNAALRSWLERVAAFSP